MTAKTPAQLKQLFETGDVMVQTSFEDAFDSYVNVLQTTAQAVLSALSLAVVSASSITVVGTVQAATGNFSAVNAATVSANVVSASSVFVNRLQRSVDTSVVAAGNSQATARVLTAEVSQLVTVSAGTNAGIIASAHPGRSYRVFNRATDNAQLYPQTGAQINALGTNNPIVVSASGTLAITYMSATQAFSVT